MSREVYLAGPVTGLAKGDADDWRICAAEALYRFKIDSVDPMRMLPSTMPMATVMTDVIDGNATSGSATLERCLWDVRRCDAVLVNLSGAKTVSIGTTMEIAWARAYDKPIIIVGDLGVHDHCMIRHSTPYVVDSLDEAVDILFRLFS